MIQLPRRRVLSRLILLKLAYLSVSLVAILSWAGVSPGRFNLFDVRWPRSDGPVLGSHFAAYDVAHYLYLSELGYHAGAPSCAFYPLWPLMIQAVSPLTGGSHLVASIVLANACSALAWALFFLMAQKKWSASVAWLALAFLISFPGSVFFQFGYSESLFFLLLMGLWYGLELRSYWVASVAAVLLPLTRAVGVLAVLPILYYVIRELAALSWNGRSEAVNDEGGGQVATGYHPMGGRGETPEGGVGRDSRSDPAGEQCRSGGWATDTGCGGLPFAVLLRTTVAGPVLVFGAVLVGWGAYLALMWHWTGNAFEAFGAQEHWGVHSVMNLVDLPGFVRGFVTATDWHAFTGSVLDRCVFLLLVYCLPIIWRLDKGLIVWTYWLGILPAMSGTFTSYTRFASCAFPLFIALAAFLHPKMGIGSSRLGTGLRWGLLVGFTVIHASLLWRFVNFRWAG